MCIYIYVCICHGMPIKGGHPQRGDYTGNQIDEIMGYKMI